MTRQLILMRHAKSSWDHPGVADHDRPLNARGRSAAPRMARHLHEHALLPELILASTATRVCETLLLMSEQWPHEVPVRFEKLLYLASRETLAAFARKLPDTYQRVMIVGHNPGLSEFATSLGGARLDLPTAAIAAFESTPATWSGSLATVQWREMGFWTPRDLAD